MQKFMAVKKKYGVVDTEFEPIKINRTTEVNG